jgi:hypothetical protein
MTVEIAALARAANIELPVVAKRQRQPDAQQEAKHIAAIAKATDPTRARQAYAKWLADAGDALGPLALVGQASVAIRAREKKLLEKQAAKLVGPLAQWIAKEWIEPTWQRGFIDAIELRIENPMGITGTEVLRTLLGHPSARLLRDIRIAANRDVGGHTDDYQPLIDVLVETRKPVSLREFAVSGVYGSPCGDVSRVWTAFPDLTHFSAFGAEITLGAIEAPNLKYIRIDLLNADGEVFQAISAANAAKLEMLIYPALDAAAQISALAPVLRGRFRKLKTLAFNGVMNPEPLVAALLASPTAKRVTQLSLWNTKLSKKALTRLKAAFGKALDLS